MRAFGRHLALGLLVVLVVSTGCRNESATVAVIPRTTATLLWEPMHLGVVEAARSRGYHIYWNAPAEDGDLEKQLSEFTSCVERRYSGIIFAPDETVASRSVVLDAVGRGLPVVIVNDQLGPPAGRLLSYVRNDEALGARLAAERVAEILHAHGSIAIIAIDSRNESGLFREEEFERVMARIAPAIQIVHRQFGDPIVTRQQQIAQEILESHKADAIVAMTAIGTRGAYYAKLASKNAASVRIVGFDQDLISPIQSGDVDSVVVEDTRTIGQIAMANLAAEAHGSSVKGVTLVPPLLMTRENMNAPEFIRLWQFSAYAWQQQ